MFGKYENINYIIMIVTQDLVCNSILSLHLAMGRGVVSLVSCRMVSLVIMVSLARMVSLASMVCLDLVRKVKCIYRSKCKQLRPRPWVRIYIRVVNGSGAMVAIIMSIIIIMQFNFNKINHLLLV